MTDTVSYLTADHIATITLNRPEVLNAVDQAMATALGAALERADADPDVRAIVLTGAGDRAFCAGMDLRAFVGGESAAPDAHPEWGFAGMVRQRIDTPVVAAVNGAAFGGGAELVLACDLAIAGRSARFGFPEVTRGLVAGAGGVIRLQRQVPHKLALEVLLTGRPLTAERALALGLVNSVVDDEAVVAAATDLARVIAANAPLAIRATKAFVRDSARYGSDWDDEMWAAHEAAVMPVFDTDDAREGATAFAQKRPPQWQGR